MYEEKTMIKPRNITIATYLLLLSVFLELIVVVLDKQYIDNTPRSIAIFSVIIGFMFTIWLIFKIATGRNWARYILLILGIIGLIPTWRHIIESSMLVNTIEVASLIVGVFGTYLIFFGSGRLWFKKKNYV